MSQIVISPYSRPLRNGQRNAKDYPWWPEVISALRFDGHKIIQIGRKGETPLGGAEQMFDLSFDELWTLISESGTWISVDNFLPHFLVCRQLPDFIYKRGVVLWGKSDPKHFGYTCNINLVEDTKNFRQAWRQFDTWEAEPYDPKAFVDPPAVLSAVNSLLGKSEP